MAISKESIKSLHAAAAHHGLISSGNRDKLLALVFEQTGKERVRDLTEREGAAIRARIRTLGKGSVPGMIRPGQIRKAWKLLYLLCEMDPREGVSARARMAGAIKAILKIEAPKAGDLFRWIDEKMGARLIEGLKRYAGSAGKKKDR